MKNGVFQTILFTGAAAAALSACTTIQVSSDVNTRESIANCHTYAWLQTNQQPMHAAFSNPVNQDRLKSAVDANLQAHGLTLAAKPEVADCMVGEAIGTRMVYEGDPGPYGFGWGGSFGWRRRGWGWGGGVGWDYPYEYPEGRVAVDLFNAKTHQPIWHAYANATIGDLTGPQAEARINAAVAAIFSKYPGGPLPAAPTT